MLPDTEGGEVNIFESCDDVTLLTLSDRLNVAVADGGGPLCNCNEFCCLSLACLCSNF